MIRVSFQGELGAYGQAAALSFFEDEITTVPCPTFADAIRHVTEGTVDSAIIPVENSIEGSVGESYDLLYSEPLYVIGETYHRIQHCLIGTGSLGDVDTIYSHPQALGQCRRFIQEHKFKTVPTYDTAGSVPIIKSIDRDNVACIASREASAIYGVPVIADQIATNPTNYTRFLVLGNDPLTDRSCNKTSIIFSVRHEPDALYRVMSKFHNAKINLTKIESRPTRTTIWEYNFYVDFEGNEESPEISRALAEIKDHALFFKSLGSYMPASL